MTAPHSLSQVAAVLWQLVVVEADLMGHLSAIKDYFLLAKVGVDRCGGKCGGVRTSWDTYRLTRLSAACQSGCGQVW